MILDFASFVIQIVGGAYASPTAPEETIMKGIHIYMGGIGIQQFFIVLFIGLTVRFHLEMNTIETSSDKVTGGRRNWRRLLYVIYASLCLITVRLYPSQYPYLHAVKANTFKVRIIFRLVQYNSGKDAATNPLIGQEAYLYVLEAIPMMGAIACFIIVHPGGIVDAHMPGLWAAMKNSICGRRGAKRGRREVADPSSEGLTGGKYLELDESPHRRF